MRYVSKSKEKKNKAVSSLLLFLHLLLLLVLNISIAFSLSLSLCLHAKQSAIGSIWMVLSVVGSTMKIFLLSSREVAV